MHINGVWEVPTLVDLAKQGKLGFEWGAIELPVFFNHACTYSDSHAFAIPNNAGKPMTPEKHAAVLEVINWMRGTCAVLGDGRPHPGAEVGDRIAPNTRRCSRRRPTPC